MATVIHETPEGREFIEVSTVADWLESQGWPQGWHAFDGDRRLGPDDVALLNDKNVTLRVASVPGAMIPAAYYAVIAVVAAAVAIYAMSNVGVPEVATNRNASSSNNELSGRGNKPAKIGQRIPDIWGLEPRAYPLLLSSYRRFDFVSGFESELSFLMLGAGRIHTANWLDGDTQIEVMAGASLEVYGPNKSPYRSSATNYTPDQTIGRPIERSLAPKVIRQSNEIDGVTVSAPNAQDVGTALLIMPDGWLEILNAGAGGELAGRFNIGDSVILSDCYAWQFFFIDGAPPQIFYTRHSLVGTYTVEGKDATRIQVTPGAQPGWAFVPVGGANQANYARRGFVASLPGEIVYGPVSEYSPGSYSTAVFGSEIGREYYSPLGASTGTNVIGPISATDCTGVIVNIVARNGLYKINTSGDPEVELVEMEAVINHPDGTITNTFNLTSNTINKRDATGVTREYEWSTRGDATVTIRRVTGTDKDYAGTVVDEVQWRDLYMIRQLPTDYNPGNVTTCLLAVQSNADAARVKERKLNCMATRYITGDRNADARFATVLPALHADGFNGRRAISTIDTDTLNLLAAEISAASLSVNYPVEGRVCGYTFDDTNLSYEDELRLLCKAVNLRPYHIGGDISFVWEYKRPVDCLLTHKDIVPGTFKLQRNFTPSREFTGVELSYKNRVRGEQLTVTAGPQEAPEAIEYKGQHYEDMATYAANSQYARQRYQRISVELEAGQIIRRLAVGMRLQVEDCTRYKSVGGEIAAVSGLALTTNQPVPDGVTAIWLSRRNGDAYRVDCTKTGAKQVTLAGGTVLPEPLYTDWQERRTRYLLWGATDAVKPLDLLVTEIDIKGGSSGVVRLVNYDERYYQWPI